MVLADPHMCSFMNERRCSELPKGRRQTLWKTAHMLIISLFFFAFGFQRNFNRCWEGICEFVWSYSNFHIRAVEGGGWERRQTGWAELTKPLRALWFWGQACLEPCWKYVSLQAFQTLAIHMSKYFIIQQETRPTTTCNFYVWTSKK